MPVRIRSSKLTLRSRSDVPLPTRTLSAGSGTSSSSTPRSVLPAVAVSLSNDGRRMYSRQAVRTFISAHTTMAANASFPREKCNRFGQRFRASSPQSRDSRLADGSRTALDVPPARSRLSSLTSGPSCVDGCQGRSKIRPPWRRETSVNGGDPPAVPGRHPEFDSSGHGMRNSQS